MKWAVSCADTNLSVLIRTKEMKEKKDLSTELTIYISNNQFYLHNNTIYFAEAVWLVVVTSGRQPNKRKLIF